MARTERINIFSNAIFNFAKQTPKRSQRNRVVDLTRFRTIDSHSRPGPLSQWLRVATRARRASREVQWRVLVDR